MGTISAFAYRHRETKKNLCRGGRSQGLPNNDFYQTVRCHKPGDHIGYIHRSKHFICLSDTSLLARNIIASPFPTCWKQYDMPISCLFFIPGLVGCCWGFGCCSVHGQFSVHMPKFQCRSAILITSVARWFERLVWSTSWAQSVADGSGVWGLEPMYTAHIHFHPLHFYNPPKNLLFVLGSHNRKTCRSTRALGDNEQGW